MTREISTGTGLVEIARGAGAVTLRYVGVPAIGEEAHGEIRSAIDEFLDNCETMIIWYAGIERFQDAIHDRLSETVSRDKPFRVSTVSQSGEEHVLAHVPGDKLVDAFSRGGAFEQAYTKAFVAFAYHTWEEAARPKIASALKVQPKDVKSDLMGQWRYLRHWVIHTSKDNKETMFKEAINLVSVLRISRENPILNPDMAFSLMAHLNRMKVDVNPSGLDWGLETTPTTPDIVAGIVDNMAPGEAVSLLIMASHAHLAADIIFDETSGVIHMRDCTKRGQGNEGLGDRRLITVQSLQFARAVVQRLGKDEQLCEHCIAAE